MRYLTTTHPKNGYDVTLTIDEDNKLIRAEYSDDEDVELSPAIKLAFTADIETFLK